MSQAEDDRDDAAEIGRRMHDLLVDTCRNFAAEDGASSDLAEALEHLLVAERRTWQEINTLRAHRATELWLAAQEVVS